MELVCIVHARPSPTVNWTLNGMPVDLDAHAEEKDGGHRHSLRISQVTEEDFGDYVCTAHNDLGTVTGSIHMTGEFAWLLGVRVAAVCPWWRQVCEDFVVVVAVRVRAGRCWGS